MNKEDFFIKEIASNSTCIGDDGAVIGNYVYSMDAFFENVHFKKNWLSLKQIAYKAMLINISDAIVMNAYPKYALISIGIPSNYTEENLRSLAKGFKKAAKKYSIEIIGGDTICNEKLDISITIISKVKNPIYRNNIQPNDYLCYTGTIGTCKKDLNRLFLNKKIQKNSKFIKPKLRSDFFYNASKYINSALDISDGLFFELERLSKANKIGFKFFYPISEDVGTSGEEYEILFSFNKKNIEKIKKIAKKHNTPINIFGKATDGKYICNYKNHHF